MILPFPAPYCAPKAPNATQFSCASPLTEREAQVVELVGAGLSNKEIGAIVGGISDNTVRAHFAAAAKTLGTRGMGREATYRAYLHVRQSGGSPLGLVSENTSPVFPARRAA